MPRDWQPMEEEGVEVEELSSELNERMVAAIQEKCGWQQEGISSGQEKASNIESLKKSLSPSPSKQLPLIPLQSQRILKEYFQSYITAILNKMQQTTNERLQTVLNRLTNIESHISQRKSRLSDDKEVRTQRKNTYIKSREKLDYVDKILKGKCSVEQVAFALNLKEKVVRSWIANRESLREKEGRKGLQDILL